MRLLHLLVLLSLLSNTLIAQTTIPFVQKNTAAFSKVDIDSIQYIYSDNDGLIDEINTFNLFLKNAKHAELADIKNNRQSCQFYGIDVGLWCRHVVLVCHSVPERYGYSSGFHVLVEYGWRTYAIAGSCAFLAAAWR